jgi:hypothetical protein
LDIVGGERRRRLRDRADRREGWAVDEPAFWRDEVNRTRGREEGVARNVIRRGKVRTKVGVKETKGAPAWGLGGRGSPSSGRQGDDALGTAGRQKGCSVGTPCPHKVPGLVGSPGPALPAVVGP